MTIASATRDAARVPLAFAMRGKRRPKLIGVAIFLLQALTTPSRNIFDPSVSGHDIKDPACPHQYASDVRACCAQMGRTHRFDQVASAEASHPAWPFGFADWEPTFVYIAHLPALPASCRDQPGMHLLELQACWGGSAATGCIDPVLFGQSSGAAVPFGEATRAGFNRQASRFESLIERKPRAIHHGGICEWCCALSLHPRQDLWPVAQKVFLNPITLFNARPQSSKLEKPLASAYPFPPNGSCMQAYRGLVSFRTCFPQVPALGRGVADCCLQL